MGSAVLAPTQSTGRIKKLMESFSRRGLREARKKAFNLSKLAYVQRTSTRLDGAPARQVSLYFRTSACAHACVSMCTMCGFMHSTTGTKGVSAGRLLDQFRSTYGSMKRRCPVVALYDSGSFLDDRQFPSEAREGILGALGVDDVVGKVLIESRPEFVTAEAVRQAKQLLGGKTLEVGIGLESSDDFIREHCVNKGFSRGEFEQAIAVLKEQGASTLCYALLKPPFLTEREAIEDAVRTAEYAFSVGVDRVVIEPAFVERGTLLETMLKRGMYSVPWLWTVLAVLERTWLLGDVSIGYPSDSPKPEYIAENFHACTPRFWKFFDLFNRTGVMDAAHIPSCGCRDEWERILAKEAAPLRDRYNRELRAFVR